jgi:hypothetical protein
VERRREQRAGHRDGAPQLRTCPRTLGQRHGKTERADGVTLIINSALRSNASLHRLGTELDLGPPAAYAWLAANGEPFHFTQRYSWPRVGSVRPLGPGTLDEWAKLWHPHTRVTVPGEQPEFLLSS